MRKPKETCAPSEQELAQAMLRGAQSRKVAFTMIASERYLKGIDMWLGRSFTVVYPAEVSWRKPDGSDFERYL